MVLVIIVILTLQNLITINNNLKQQIMDLSIKQPNVSTYLYNVKNVVVKSSIATVTLSNKIYGREW